MKNLYTPSKFISGIYLRKNLFLLLNLCWLSPAFAQNIDIDLLKKINVNRNTSLDPSFKFITNTAEPLAIAMPISAFAIGLAKKDKDLQRKGLEMLGSLAVSTAVNYSLKYAFNRDRPYITYPFIQNSFVENDPSFPSGHTSVAFSVATSLSLQYPKWYVIVPSYLWASSVGYSRLFLGVHYPSDILGGAIVGAGSAFLCHKANKWLQKRKK